jgi:tyrosine-protein phosphatase SIW14
VNGYQISYWRDSVTLFKRAIAVTKDNYRMHHSLAYELISQGRLDEGIYHYRRALAITPSNVEIHYNLANTLRRQGKIDEAIEEYRLAVQYKNDYADAHNNLAYALLSQGKFDEAKQHFIAALNINPEHSYALTGLAQVLAAHPNRNLRDPEMAVELAERAAALTSNQNATIIDMLTVARETQRADKTVWAKSVKLPGLPNFHKVSDALYRGAQPTKEGMRQLEKMRIKTVVNLRSFRSDRDEIGDANLAYEHIYMKPWHPEDKEIVRFLKIVTDANRTPVFVHCRHGADRTGTMCAVYRIVVQGWSKDKAIEEMTEGGFGFHKIWGNLPDYIRDLDVEKLRQQAGIKQSTIDN